jgi:hypothetical protein
MLRLQAAGYSTSPLMQPADQDRSPGSCSAGVRHSEITMTSCFVKLVVTLALALAAATTVSFAQSRPQSCIPHYDTSGAQAAPYC